LQENEGLTLSALSPLCSIGLPSLSVSLRNLQKSGLIRKEGTGKNQRVYLTETGRQRAWAFHLQIDAFYQAYFQHLGPEKTQQLRDSLADFDQFLQDYRDHYEGQRD
jgi:DNA-binding MarR family transcriptional regulator